MSDQPARRAVFLDKDGTLVENVPYNVDPRRVRLVPEVGPALRLLRDAGFSFFVVSNQSGVARGLYDEEALAPVRQRLKELLAEEGIELGDVYFCPHHPHGVRRDYAVECLCRKPMPGMLQRAAQEHGVDLDRSWLVGDILDDVEAGVRAGCRTVLVDNGGETEWRMSELRLPHHVAVSLQEAARLILEDEHVLDWRHKAVAVT